MDGITIAVDGDEMTIKVNLKRFKVSKTGKSDVITSNGFAPIEGTDYKVGLNVIRPRKAQPIRLDSI